MIYQVIKPGVAISNYIKYYWYLYDPLGNAGHQKDLLIPDGSLEWVLNDNTQYNRFELSSDLTIVNESVIVGRRNKSILANRPGTTRLVGIKFKPGALYIMSQIPESEFKNVAICTDLVLPKETKELETRVFNSSSLQEMKMVLDDFFFERFKAVHSTDFQLITAIIHYINKANDYPNLESIWTRFNLSKKKLERLFAKYVGLSPKSYIRVIRFKQVYKHFNKANTSFYDHSFFQYGYYDQMHFIKDFKYFTGQSPTQYYSNQSNLSDDILIETLRQLKL